MSVARTVPLEIDDPVNARILAVSEDRVQGFPERPFAEISRLTGVDLDVVLERVREMLEAGTIRRGRQTLLATSLAPGALVAWRVPPERLDDAFRWMFDEDPFFGHVVNPLYGRGDAGLGVSAPFAYREWCERVGLDPERMREE